MAKYTETFAEWLDGGGVLPSEFDQIDGFDDLFVGYWCNAEIGMETPDLFQIKLDAYAALHVPVYKQRIDDYAAAIAAMSAPERTETEKSTPGTETITNWELPTNGGGIDTTPPSSAGTTEHTEGVTERTYTGVSAGEAQARVAMLQGKIYNAKIDLLNEFRPIFMMVY